MLIRRVLPVLVAATLVVLPVLPTASASSGSSGSAEAGALDTAAIDDYIDDYTERNGLPGGSVAVVKDGATVYERGFGEGSDGEAVTETTRLRTESLSKSVTAFAVLQLVDEGLVDLDQPVRTYLPEVELDDERIDEVTVRQILSHTSGIQTPTIIAPASDIEEGVARTHDWQLGSEPGTRYYYSNANYWIAARLVEVVSGEPFADYLQGHIFEPLGMKDSLTAITSGEEVPGVTSGHVTAYGRALEAPEPEQMFAGAGGVVSSAHDWALWLAMQQRGGVAEDGQRLLSADLVTESHTAQPGAANSGLGWHLSGAKVTPARIGHSGAGGASQQQQDLVPSSGYGVVVLLNSFTVWKEHAYAMNDDIIEITEGRTPTVGTPVPTVIDLALGGLTVLVAGLGVLGLRRASRWAARRGDRARWRTAMRLSPYAIAPLLAVGLLVVAPMLQDNSLTSADVFRLAPAAMLLVLVAGVVSVLVVVARTVALRPRTAAAGGS